MIARRLARFLLPVLLPIACAWVRRQEACALADGKPLDAAGLADARALGIRAPERVRVLAVDRVPLPGGSGLARTVGLLTGTLSQEASGITLGHGIFLRRSFRDDRSLLVHELAHVRQCEYLGGIRPFLRRYLHECLTAGYLDAPMEQEAREAAATLCG